jgi:hypothetical protein
MRLTNRWAMSLLSLVAALAVAGESAGLTISGYVPSTQKVSAIQTKISTAGRSAIVLQEQGNSGLGYTLTVETKTPSGQRGTSTPIRVATDTQRINLTNGSVSISRPPTKQTGPRSPRTLEIARPSANTNATLLLTIASE